MSDSDYWNRHADAYDRSLRLLGGPIPRMVELAAEAVRGSSRVLEVAAGTGLVTPALARAASTVVATDYAGAMVEKLRAKIAREGLTNVSCEPADLYALRFGPGSFDAVVAANVLHLVPRLPEALRSLRRMLAPGGRLIVPTFLHDQTLLSAAVSRLLALTGFPGNRRFTAASFRATLEAEGLELARFEVLPGVIPIGYADSIAGRA